MLVAREEGMVAREVSVEREVGLMAKEEGMVAREEGPGCRKPQSCNPRLQAVCLPTGSF